MRMMDCIYLVDEDFGTIIPIEAGRYRVVRNNDEMTRTVLEQGRWHLRQPERLLADAGSVDLGYVDLG
ncbi:hypothetical protein B5K05_13500 [Rhizobium phaseoli]|uniref:hypothetical protein n=1 Tax=Rhizobium phaseoli TaxID=396 RepID=UPI000E0DE390|nr:hypothetical protein [Rhizobium phaseoli]RDJ10139.1 hypothetical protein B5K04_13475 [Rhizobium phaseoli]RDJ14139.1 hypothetical protein B5K05_13500 [Rhizobium phaseoli]